MTGPNSGIALAEQAARALFDDPTGPVAHEPRGADEASAAVHALAERFQAGGGTLEQIIENARAGAEVLSSDRFQALSEIVQNADDSRATEVRVELVGDELHIVHDGRPLQLCDVHALAAPWLTTKKDDASAVGRFGIGLMTINAIADSFEMHSGDYHVRFGAPSLDVTAPQDKELGPGQTLLRVPLRDPVDAGERLIDWARRWDHASLLFLRSVKRIAFVVDADEVALALTWDDPPAVNRPGTDPRASPRRATAGDRRSWIVFTDEVDTPAAVQRAHKRTDATTTVAVALCTSGHDRGVVYAGLPIATTGLPVRINAQFDPVASRQDLMDDEWNLWLVDPIARLWGAALLDVFERDPQVAWRLVPIAAEEGDDHPVLVALHDAVLATARTKVATSLELDVAGVRHRLDDLAHEVPELEGLLSDEELSQVAGTTAALPLGGRDPDGRWRVVLADWAEAGIDLPPPVTIEDALPLLERDDMAPRRAIALAAAALASDLDDALGGTAFVVLPDGSRIEPPGGSSLDFLRTSEAGLAATLGLGHPVHPEHLDAADPPSRAVLAWLQERGAVVERDDRAVIHRLADAGEAGVRMRARLDDDQLAALRNGIERLAQDEWGTLTPSVGRAILVEGRRMVRRGPPVVADVAPPDAYLGRTIDREPDSFAVAAADTPGLVWVAARYSTVLRSSLGRQGLGALRFLRLLGAETTPRLQPHPALTRRYASNRLGLKAYAAGGPAERARAIRQLDATYSLDDLHSPDLDRVLKHIATDPKARRRRTRAEAVVATLGRGWTTLADRTEVTAADDYTRWIPKGQVRAWWLWEAATIPWLDDDGARPSRPIDLRRRTPATLAVNRTDGVGFLHPSFRDMRPDVLAALGVRGEPTLNDLCARLRELRVTPEDAPVADECAVLYRAMADRIGSLEGRRDTAPTRTLVRAFGEGQGLVHTARGWRRPAEVFTGRPIFGDRRAFTPAIAGCDALWRALRVRRPGVDDCIDVLAEMGRDGIEPDVERETVQLETVRELGRLLADAPSTPARTRRLARLPLWTSRGWTKERPVYAVHDPVMADGLRGLIPVWLPGGEVSQFRSVLPALRLTEVAAAAGRVVERAPTVDEDLTDLFRAAAAILHEDLVRNDPAVSTSLCVPWSELDAFEVVIEPQITVELPQIEVDGRMVSVDVAAKADATRARIYVTTGDLLSQLDGGRAIAGLFASDQRRVAQAWLAAAQGATANRVAAQIQLAEERAADEQRRNDEVVAQQATALQREAAARRRSTSGGGSAGTGRGATMPKPAPPRPTAQPRPPRRLVDPSALRVVDPDGVIVAGPGTGSRTSSGTASEASLRSPRTGGRGPRNRSAPRGYTDLDKETVGYEIARLALASDAEGMADLRNQRGVGADAIDELRRFFELKVHLGPEPDEIRLTDSEVRRALSTPDFFLVVVSGVEEGHGPPRVRIIPQPLHQLTKLDHRDMRLGGVKSVRTSLVYGLTEDT